MGTHRRIEEEWMGEARILLKELTLVGGWDGKTTCDIADDARLIRGHYDDYEPNDKGWWVWSKESGNKTQFIREGAEQAVAEYLRLKEKGKWK